MKHYVRSIILFFLLLSILVPGFISCSKKDKPTEEKADLVVDEEKMSNGFIRVTLNSKEIADNKIGVHTFLDCYVYLPESYESSDKKYAVLYYLHGYEGSPRNIVNYLTAIKEYNSAHPDKQLIFVGTSGYNSFYTNSDVRGNWENHIMKEVLPYIDSSYRTIKSAEGRIITGFSMGGTGALKLGMKYPDTFSLVYAHTPGLFDENGLENAFGIWNDSFKRDYAQTFSYNDSGEPVLPSFDGSDKDAAVIKNWEKGFGNITAKLDDYEKNSSKLKSIKVVYGLTDQNFWIVDGSKYFISELEKRNIPHESSEYDGGHQFSQEHFKDELLPFVIKNI